MATIFIVLVLATFVVNSIIMRSSTPWWRDPGSLFRREDEAPEPPVVENRRALDPGDLAPRRSAEVRVRTGTRGRHAVREDAVREDDAATEVLARVPVGTPRRGAPEEGAVTELLARVPADRPGSGRRARSRDTA